MEQCDVHNIVLHGSFAGYVSGQWTRTGEAGLIT